MKSFFFYDLETSGLSGRTDRIMQFAGQRTDMDLKPIGDPINLLVRLADDTLPSPRAIRVTGITPQQTMKDGITEAELARLLQTDIFTPDTCAVGYNNIAFDDVFISHLFWRNFYDPYTWFWEDGRSRWDLLDVVRMTRALRPDGINWPVDQDGKETNRLELLSKLNGIAHESAHDALSDVRALIGVTRLIRDKQPSLYSYLFGLRGKKSVLELVNLDSKKPFVYTSGAYSSEFHNTTIAFPLTSGKNGNIIVYDLRHDPDVIITAEKQFPTVRELAPNKCPAVAPVNVLELGDGWHRLGLTHETVDAHLQKLLSRPDFAEQVREQNESRPEFPPPPDSEAALYDGFLSDADRRQVALIPTLDQDRLADHAPDFSDPRLPDLFIHYKARNFPRSLSATEAEQWEIYRLARLRSQTEAFGEELAAIAKDSDVDPFVLEELRLWAESVLPSE